MGYGLAGHAVHNGTLSCCDRASRTFAGALSTVLRCLYFTVGWVEGMILDISQQGRWLASVDDGSRIVIA